MPTLNELRDWLMGNIDSTSDLPSRCKWDGWAKTELPTPDQESFFDEDGKEENSTVGGELSMDKMRKKRAPRTFVKPPESYGGKTGAKVKISVDGDDAILSFGKHKGASISGLLGTEDGRSYLRWMLKQDFSDELLEVVKKHMDAWVEAGKPK